MKTLKIMSVMLWYAVAINLMIYFGDQGEPRLGAVALISIVFIISVCLSKRKRVCVKYFDNGIREIKKIAVGDWIDLRAAERIELKAGEYRLIPLGVGMILPYGYEAYIVPRSSAYARFGIFMTNSMGVVDNSYSGDSDEWHFPALAFRDTVIEKGDRIAQFRIMENQPGIKFETVDHLNIISRGGVGSTGHK